MSSGIITATPHTIVPTLVIGYEAARASRNIVHDILGSETPDVTYRPAKARSGRMRLLFATAVTSGYDWIDGYYVEVIAGSDPEADSLAAVNVLATYAGPMQFTAAGRDTLAMTFVVGEGDITRTLDATTRRTWVVEFDYQEVAP